MLCGNYPPSSTASTWINEIAVYAPPKLRIPVTRPRTERLAPKPPGIRPKVLGLHEEYPSEFSPGKPFAISGPAGTDPGLLKRARCGRRGKPVNRLSSKEKRENETTKGHSVKRTILRTATHVIAKQSHDARP
jgi:hypothetical protein